MKKFIALLALVLVSASTMMYAQESNAAARRAERKAQRDAERAKLRAEEEVQDMAAYQQAVQALKNKQFVLEANQVIFRNGMSAFAPTSTKRLPGVMSKLNLWGRSWMGRVMPGYIFSSTAVSFTPRAKFSSQSA